MLLDRAVRPVAVTIPAPGHDAPSSLCVRASGLLCRVDAQDLEHAGGVARALRRAA
jgi:hypothetical protein